MEFLQSDEARGRVTFCNTGMRLPEHAKVIALLSAAEKAHPNPNSSDGRLNAFLTAAENPQAVTNDAHAQAVMTKTTVTESGAVVEGAAAPAAEGPVAADGGQCRVL